MMKYLYKLFKVLFWICLIISCQRESLQTPMEATKSLNGNWKITKALRNGTDMTSRFDFSKFSISFKDSSYHINSPVPFPVIGDGIFYVDDPKYPFKIFLKETGTDTKTLNMEFPIKEGKRNIIIRFSPGCSANTYEYTLQNVTE